MIEEFRQRVERATEKYATQVADDLRKKTEEADQQEAMKVDLTSRLLVLLEPSVVNKLWVWLLFGNA